MGDYVTDRIIEYDKDDELYFKECLVIRDHDTSKLLPFELNRGQAIMHRVLEKQLKEIGRVRATLLKSRRFGGSTYTEARFYKRTSMHENKNAFIIGHEEKSTNTLFAMAKLFHERNPLAPSQKKSNAQELEFDNKQGTGLKSKYELATAKNVDAGRSQGVHFLHGSEVAYWPKNTSKELLDGVLQCLPDPPSYSEALLESTANGYGNVFQEYVFESYADGLHPFYEEDGIIYAWGSPRSDWIVIFIPWFAVEKYSMEIPARERKDFELSVNAKVYNKYEQVWIDSEEKILKNKFSLSYEQLYWRRWAISNKCSGAVQKFRQEYPATVIEAFLSRGSNVFTKEFCDELEEQIDTPILIGDIYRSVGKSRISRNKDGDLTVWEKPIRGDSYFLTCDVAGGLDETELRKPDREPDKTTIDVYNHRTGNQAAEWNGHIDYEDVHEIVMMLGEMYCMKGNNNLKPSMAAVELNNQGHAVVALLKENRYPQYKRENKKEGWETNKRTKPWMVTNYRKCLRDSTLKINSLGKIAEMRTYIEFGKKYNAAPGCNDDRVITGCIAAAIIDEIPRQYEQSNSGSVGFKNLERESYDSDYQEYYA